MKKTLQEFRQDCQNMNYPIMPDETLDTILLNVSEGDQILEIGTCVGYSSTYLASHKSVSIITLEKDEQRAQEARENLKSMENIDFIEMDALQYQTTQLFDVIIFDGAKASNQKFFDHFIKNLKQDGIIFVDNIYFHGLVEDIDSIKDRKNLYRMVKKLKEFINSISNNPNYKTQIINVGDGLMKITRA